MEIEYIKVNDVVYDIHDPNGGGSSDELWKPTVDSSGNISWQKSTSPALPIPQNIKGQPGENGSDGVSPGVTVTTITGGHRVTITDAAHPSGQSFDVMDGSGGGGTTSPWSGKRFLVIGDSGSYVGTVSGVTLNNNWWRKLISELGFRSTEEEQNPSKVMAYPGQNIHTIVDHLTENDVAGIDLIIFEGGANNAWNTPLGQIGDVYPSQNTVCGQTKYAINRIFGLLEDAGNLTCRVMFVAPYCTGPNQSSSDGYELDINGVSQAVEDTANYDALPCYNCYKESGINRFTWDVYKNSSTDLEHLNLSGNSLIGRSVAQFIRNRVFPYEQVI